MNEHEMDRLAAAMNAARPDWPLRSLRTFVGNKLAARPFRDAFVALAWVASEPATSSPARVLEAGPWWRAAAVDGALAKRSPFDVGTHCGICSEVRERCRLLWTEDHEFELAAHGRARKGTVDISPVVVEVKGHIQPAPSGALHEEEDAT